MAKKDKKKKNRNTPQHLVSATLDRTKELHEMKSAEYGPTAPDKHGKIMEALFPDGIKIKGADAFTLFVHFDFIIAKIVRASHSLEKDPHLDSFKDLVTYAAMASSKANEIVDKQYDWDEEEDKG